MRRCTTRFIGIRLSRFEACVAVRGNPSRIREAEEVRAGAADALPEAEESHPLDDSSEDINSNIVASGTRFPELRAVSTLAPGCMLVSVWLIHFRRQNADKEPLKVINIPKAVLFRTLSLNRSPELIDASCWYLLINRSVCVPFPTPGAPTSIILAAFLRRFATIDILFP